MTKTVEAEEGFAVPVLVLVLTVAVLGVVGVSVDLWRVLATHQRLMAVADAAAVAGAGGVDVDRLYGAAGFTPVLDPGAATSLACAYLVENTEMTRCPGPGAAVEVADDTVTVEVEARVPLSLLRLLFAVGGGPSDVDVAATATAVAIRLPAPGP